MKAIIVTISVLLFGAQAASAATAIKVSDFMGLKLGAGLKETEATLEKKAPLVLVDIDRMTLNGKPGTQESMLAVINEKQAEKHPVFMCTLAKNPSDLPPAKSGQRLVCGLKNASTEALRGCRIELYRDKVYEIMISFEPSMGEELMKGVRGKFGVDPELDPLHTPPSTFTQSDTELEALCRPTTTCRTASWVQSDFNRGATVLFDGKSVMEGKALGIQLRDRKLHAGLIAEIKAMLDKKNKGTAKQLGL